MKKVILVIVITVLIVGVSLFLFFKFYGKSMVETALSNALGSKIRFRDFSVNLKDYTANFKGISMPGKFDFGDKSIFDAETFTITLDKERFAKDKEIIFDHIVIKKAILHIIRNKRGVFNVSYNKRLNPPGRFGVAYAQEPKPNAFYNFAKSVRKLTITDSTIEFNDHYLADSPYTIVLDDFNLNITSSIKPDSSQGSIPVRGVLSFLVPNDTYGSYGEVSVSANMGAYTFLTDVEAVLQTQGIDLMQFKPYFEHYTPFIFMEGLFSSRSNFRMQTNMINSLTTMLFHRLRLMVNPDKQNADFLNISVNKLLPYLTAESGEVVFDFVIRGPLDSPSVGLGPQVQTAISAVAVEEIGRVIQGLQGLK